MILQSLHRIARFTDSEVARMRINREEQDERQEVYLHFVSAMWLHIETYKSLPVARASMSIITSGGDCIFTYLIK